jgi:NitT/TauT family transport system substrate-binding protein
MNVHCDQRVKNAVNAVGAAIGVLTVAALILSACAPATQAPAAPTEMPPEPTLMPTEAPPEPTAAPTEAAMAEPDHIVVGYLPIIAFQPFFVAQERGYFAEQNIEVEFERFASGSEMIAPLAAGQMDVGAGQPAPSLFNAVYQGLEVRIVAGTAAQPTGYPGVPILVRTDLYDSGELDDPSELAGHTYAVNVPNGIGDYLMNKVLEKVGLTLDDLSIVSMPFPEMGAAFENGAIDVAIVPSPLSGSVIGSGAAKILVDGDEVDPGVQNGVMYYGTNFLGSETDLPVRFMVAYLKAARDVQGDGWKQEENLQALGEYTGLPMEVMQKLQNLYYNDPNGYGNLDSVMDFQAFWVERGYVDYSQALALEEFTDFSFLESALGMLGEYSE